MATVKRPPISNFVPSLSCFINPPYLLSMDSFPHLFVDDELPVIQKPFHIQNDDAFTGNPLDIPGVDAGHRRKRRVQTALGDIPDAEDLVREKPQPPVPFLVKAAPV